MQDQSEYTKNLHLLDFDAFSHGQMSSKLWLCEHLEKYVNEQIQSPISISIFGSWIALLPFLILSRGKVKVRQFDLHDQDPEAHKNARRILDYWKFDPEIRINFHTNDCNKVNIRSENTDLVINTSCEHIDGLSWWKQLPQKTYFCLQTTDMVHPTHISSPESLNSWIQSLSLSSDQIFYSGEKKVSYPAFSFHRWMLIGKT